MLSAVEICLDVEALICIFLESTKLAEISDDEESATMFQFPDPQSYRDAPKSPGFSAPSSAANSPFSLSTINVVNNSLTYYILMMDILIKQVSNRFSVETRIKESRVFVGSSPNDRIAFIRIGTNSIVSVKKGVVRFNSYSRTRDKNCIRIV